jgi:hypothetical protein
MLGQTKTPFVIFVNEPSLKKRLLLQDEISLYKLVARHYGISRRITALAQA